MKLKIDSATYTCGFTLQCDCGATVDPSWKFCPQCAKPVEAPKLGKCINGRVIFTPKQVETIINGVSFANKDD